MNLSLSELGLEAEFRVGFMETKLSRGQKKKLGFFLFFFCCCCLFLFLAVRTWQLTNNLERSELSFSIMFLGGQRKNIEKKDLVF